MDHGWINPRKLINLICLIPPFDILLYKRTPLEQQINHLAIQCCENHVHPLSQILLSALTGTRSPLYIPRFAFADMPTEKAMQLFETQHDKFIKNLKSTSLFLSNLDLARAEVFADGNTL